MTCGACQQPVFHGRFFAAGRCEFCHPQRRRRWTSCAQCRAWYGGNRPTCSGCTGWRYRHPPGTCRECGSVFFVRDEHCRACWVQARILEDADLTEGQVRVDPRPYFARIARTGYQLEIGGLKRTTQLLNPRWRYRELQPAPPATVARQPESWEQLRLFDSGRDYRRFRKTDHADLDNPYLAAALGLADRKAELCGWSPELLRLTRRGLIAVLSGHQAGEAVRYSELVPLYADRKISVTRVSEVLQEAGLLDDDRPDSFEVWLVRRTQDLAPEIGEDVRRWLRAVHRGGPRRRPRSRSSSWGFMSAAHSTLLDWSGRYSHLREVTRADVKAAFDAHQGWRRKELHISLRSLFTHLRREKVIFQNPTTGIKAGAYPLPPILPLPQECYTDAVTAATTPEQQVLLVLTVVHAARRPSIKALTVDDLDLPGRAITIGGHTRPLDELTHQVIHEYLLHRHRRWPHTPNRHLLITRVTAHGHEPVSDYWCHLQFAGRRASLEQMRIDRQLEEALAGGGDPRRLAAIFGISEFTAVRYASAARALMANTLESPPPSTTTRP
ncbi:hypothetical protein [Streptomyces sp. NPDC102282]|uniref:hypothetical protein n=1 Tax=Streptomyces sp. NPDC102282 TaxID=3366154 RepID=UPI00382701A1